MGDWLNQGIVIVSRKFSEFAGGKWEQDVKLLQDKIVKIAFVSCNVKGDRSKTAKNQHDDAKVPVWCSIVSRWYDFCRFLSVAVNTYKLPLFYPLISVLLLHLSTLSFCSLANLEKDKIWVIWQHLDWFSHISLCMHRHGEIFYQYSFNTIFSLCMHKMAVFPFPIRNLWSLSLPTMSISCKKD